MSCWEGKSVALPERAIGVEQRSNKLNPQYSVEVGIENQVWPVVDECFHQPRVIRNEKRSSSSSSWHSCCLNEQLVLVSFVLQHYNNAYVRWVEELLAESLTSYVKQKDENTFVRRSNKKWVVLFHKCFSYVWISGKGITFHCGWAP